MARRERRAIDNRRAIARKLRPSTNDSLKTSAVRSGASLAMTNLVGGAVLHAQVALGQVRQNVGKRLPPRRLSVHNDYNEHPAPLQYASCDSHWCSTSARIRPGSVQSSRTVVISVLGRTFEDGFGKLNDPPVPP